MEILLTLSKIDNLSKAKQYAVDGLIFGGEFSLRFDYSKEEMVSISNYCHENGIKRYIALDAFIFEGDKTAFYEYFDFIKALNPDGIYFTDLGVLSVAKRLGIAQKLIYDPDTLLTNSLDVGFYLKQGIGVVLARELELKEVLDIISNYIDSVDMQVFGYLKMSSSKRKFLTNYFNYLKTARDIKGKKNIRLVEETRNESYPVIEDDYGTRIYTDYCLLMYRELAYIKHVIRRAIVDDLFIEDNDLAFEVIRDIRRMTPENAEFLLEALKERHPNVNFSAGYLHQKTSKTKEEND